MNWDFTVRVVDYHNFSLGLAMKTSVFLKNIVHTNALIKLLNTSVKLLPFKSLASISACLRLSSVGRNNTYNANLLSILMSLADWCGMCLV